jgi:hypothetical protein
MYHQSSEIESKSDCFYHLCPTFILLTFQFAQVNPGFGHRLVGIIDLITLYFLSQTQKIAIIKAAIFAFGVTRMKADEINKYQKERDIPVLLESLHELFQEQGDTVTPMDLAERMEKKLRRHQSLFVVSCLYTTLGFVSRAKPGQSRRRYYIVPNLELLAERQAQFCKIETDESDKR